MNGDIGVLVVGHREAFLDALRTRLSRSSGMRVLGTARRMDEALERCGRSKPDVVLLDLDLPGVDGIEATERLKRAAPGAKVVVMTEVQTPSFIARALAAGACGFVPKNGSVDGLADVVRRAAAGEMVMPADDLPLVLEELLGSNGSRNGDLTLDRLTGRETQILRALSEGSSTVEVAAELGISRLTVQSHVKSILAKLGVHSKIEAVTLA
ncbi:MAG: response regulator transcription factor, partial [Actinobacteria bacterium]|nr:response regulator transcription factor [Actinomycetota bacterium]